MAFKYLINGVVERYENNFHFWYVNGYAPDPRLKEEIEEEKKVENREGKTTEMIYSKAHNRHGGGWYK